jgi:hypothetical protein
MIFDLSGGILINYLNDIFLFQTLEAVDISIAGAIHHKLSQNGDVVIEALLQLAQSKPVNFVEVLQEAVKPNELDELVVGDPFNRGGKLLITVPGNAQVNNSNNLVISHYGLDSSEKAQLTAVASVSTSGAVEKKGTGVLRIESGRNWRAPLLSTPDIPASDSYNGSRYDEAGKAQKYSVAIKSRTHPYRNMKKSVSTHKDEKIFYRDHHSLSELMECSTSYLYRDKPSKRVINRGVLVEQTPLTDTPFATTVLKRTRIEEAQNILGLSSGIKVDDSWDDLFFTVDDVQDFVEKSLLAKELDKAMDELPVIDCPVWL